MKNIFFQVDQLCFLGKGPFTFLLQKGECVGLSGPSGIGKTQLFRALNDLIPSSGSVTLNGQAKEAIQAPNWRTMVMLVPSDSCWWFDTVAEHFQEHHRKVLVEEGRQLGLLPDMPSWQVTRLSTGEKQRLALLRALQSWPDLLLLDEPTSGLDAYHTGLVESYLMQKRKETGLTLMWVSHDPAQLARVTDRVLYMEADGLRERQ